MIYYRCARCGIDHDNGGVTIITALQDSKLAHTAYCSDCGEQCEERDTETDRDTIRALTERAEKAEAIVRACQIAGWIKEWEHEVHP